MKEMVRKDSIIGFLAVVAVLFSGCASYPEKVGKTKEQLATGFGGETPVYTACSDDGGDKLLAWIERGRLEQLQGRYMESQTEYNKAISFYDNEEAAAVVRIGKMVDDAQAVAVANDRSKDYPIIGFERMMLHQLNAFNCLAIGDQDGFGINVRHMERYRGMAKTKYEQESKAIDEMLGNDNSFAMRSSQSYKNLMDGLKQQSGGLNFSYDNAYSLYLIALYRETIGDLDEALKYYKEANAILRGNKAVKLGIERCTRKKTLPVGYGELIVFFESGFIPEKSTNEVRLFDDSLVLPAMDFQLATYQDIDSLPANRDFCLTFGPANGVKRPHTYHYCDLAQLAVKAHMERVDWIVARKIMLSGTTASARWIQNISFFVPGRVATYVNWGAAGANLVGSLILDQEDDLRSWLLLPRQVQVVRYAAKAGGPYEITLEVPGSEKKIPVTIKAGKKTIIYCTSVPSRMEAFSACLDNVR